MIRYIHQNPYKAGTVKSVDEYTFSSYNDYKTKENIMTDVDFALSIMDQETFLKYNNEISNSECLDVDEKVFRLSDPDAQKLIYKVSKCKSAIDFQMLEEKQRDSYIKKLKEHGLSIRQISRLTGVSFAIVRRIQ